MSRMTFFGRRRPMAEVMDLAPYGENNNVFCIRFSTEFEKWLAGVDSKSHEMLTVFGRIEDFCKEVSSSKNYLLERMHNDQWLQSEITLRITKKSYSIHVAIASKPQGEVLEQLPVDGDSKDVMVSPNSSPTADVDMTVRSNILPRQASLKKLGRSVASSHASKYLSLSWLLANAGVVTLKGSGRLLYKKLKEFKSRGICELLKQLSSPCLQDVSYVKLPTIPSLDVKLGDRIANGSTADVWRVTISQGIFVKKEFKCLDAAISMETQIVQMLSHPHIVHTFGCIGSNNPASKEFSLLMESMQHDLSTRISDKPLLEPLDLLDVLLQVAKAMEYLHRMNVVHGDLKTQNILFSQYDISGDDGRFIVVKVADFGSAQAVTDSNRDSFKPSAGTTTYAAPEVLRSRRTDNLPLERKDANLKDPFKVDVYSFGITAYEVLTGLNIFDCQNLKLEIFKERIMAHDLDLAKDFFKTFKEETKNYPGRFISCMQRCWAYDPEGRPSFQEIIENIEEAKEDLMSLKLPSRRGMGSRVKNLVKQLATKRINNKVCPQPTHSNSSTGVPVKNRSSKDNGLKRARESEPNKSKKKRKS